MNRVEVDKNRPTQVGRALDRLGIDHIPAYSPEARALRAYAIESVVASSLQILSLANEEHQHDHAQG